MFRSEDQDNRNAKLLYTSQRVIPMSNCGDTVYLLILEPCDIEGIQPKRPYLPAGRALLAGYYRYTVKPTIGITYGSYSLLKSEMKKYKIQTA